MDDIHQLAKADKLEVGIDYWRMLANRRLELLRRCNEYMAMCPFCRRKSTDFHADDCQLAKELSDAS